MRVVELHAENFKRLKAVTITPDPKAGTVIIAGKNAAGKSSTLDAIGHALFGAAGAKMTSKPIRSGEEHATIRLDLGELVITRTWAEGKTSQLRVESADGAMYKSPQAMLDGLVGRLSFDPLAFAGQDERKQLAELLALVDLPFDPDELAATRAGLYERRTEVGREGKLLEGQLAGLPVPAEDAPTEEVSYVDLMTAQREANRILAEHAASVREVQRRSEKVAGTRKSIDDAETALQLLNARIVEERSALNQAEADRAGLAEKLPDIAALDRQIDESGAINEKVRQAKEHAAVVEQLAGLHQSYKGISEKIEKLDADKREAIAAAKMPIEGLGFDEDGVTYQGVPFKQCSAAEQLRVSLAISMAANPRIRVVLIKDASLLDSDNMRLIEEMASAADYQIWLERIDETGTVGITIEDGAVKA